MYLAMPVTKAFLSSKLVLKFGCMKEKDTKMIKGLEEVYSDGGLKQVNKYFILQMPYLIKQG